MLSGEFRLKAAEIAVVGLLELSSRDPSVARSVTMLSELSSMNIPT